MVVDKSQNLLEVKVLLLALHSQVVEGQVNHIHPGQGGAQEEAREVAACAARAIASWGQAEMGQGGGRGQVAAASGCGWIVARLPLLTIARGAARCILGPGYIRSRRTSRTYRGGTVQRGGLWPDGLTAHPRLAPGPFPVFPLFIASLGAGNFLSGKARAGQGPPFPGIIVLGYTGLYTGPFSPNDTQHQVCLAKSLLLTPVQSS